MSVTTCADIAEDLSLHAMGEPALHVEMHLAACPACRARHAELCELCGALRALDCGSLLPLWGGRSSLRVDGHAEQAPPPAKRQRAAAVQGEAVPHFSLRRALWPIAIAASVLFALWPSSSLPKPATPEPPTWLGYQRAAARGDAALDAMLDAHADVFDRPLFTDTATVLTALAFQP